MFDLKGKVVLVTGATGGIGEAIANAMFNQGATVVLTGRKADVLESLKAKFDGIEAGRAFAIATGIGKGIDCRNHCTGGKD